MERSNSKRNEKEGETKKKSQSQVQGINIGSEWEYPLLQPNPFVNSPSLNDLPFIIVVFCNK